MREVDWKPREKKWILRSSAWSGVPRPAKSRKIKPE